MIEDILKQHKVGDKPRFFLHEEIKDWLKDHLDIKVTHGENRSMDYSLQSKLNLNNSLPVGHHVSFTLSIDNEPIAMQGFNLPLPEYEHAFRCVSNVLETCMFKITYLEQQNRELTRRIDLLENPLPI